MITDTSSGGNSVGVSTGNMLPLPVTSATTHASPPPVGVNITAFTGLTYMWNHPGVTNPPIGAQFERFAENAV